MNFQVPQFIEVEDQVFGPLTFKQFIYLTGGGGLAFLVYTLPLPFAIKIIPMLAVAGLGLALAFFKYNNQPFIAILEAGLYFALARKNYIWKKEAPKTITSQITTKPLAPTIPKLSKSKLHDLAWSLDITEKIK
ncbi:MAG: PrgI family protein [Candidatus Vogelbacteria bacterium]|nr:PrgI family protein [Candidatus Vogelbacteria bacterium]